MPPTVKNSTFKVSAYYLHQNRLNVNNTMVLLTAKKFYSLQDFRILCRKQPLENGDFWQIRDFAVRK